MRYIIIMMMGVLSFAGCEKYEIIDTGLANEDHVNKTMWDYFQTDHYNWDSVVVAIEYAGLKGVFDGTDPEHREITFFGVTCWSIKKFILSSGYECLADVPAALLRNMIMSHVIKGRILKEEVDYEVKNTLKGGTILKSLTGQELRVYRTKSDFLEMPDAGAEGMGVHGVESGHIAAVASANIRVKNGVVHSLTYEYEWKEL